MEQERLEIILSHPLLLTRAKDLGKFISSCPPEALKDNFRLIVNKIFSNGEREQQPWDLRSLRKVDYPNESAAVLKLLAADGPLITLALRLMDDHNFLLEFPLEALPVRLSFSPLFCGRGLFIVLRFGNRSNCKRN